MNTKLNLNIKLSLITEVKFTKKEKNEFTEALKKQIKNNLELLMSDIPNDYNRLLDEYYNYNVSISNECDHDWQMFDSNSTYINHSYCQNCGIIK